MTQREGGDDARAQHASVDPIDPDLGYFRSLIGIPLEVHGLDGSARPELTCTDVVDHGIGGGYHSFRVELSGVGTAPLVAETVVVSGGDQPPAYVFITPVGTDAGNTHYEAIFNQPVNPRRPGS